MSFRLEMLQVARLAPKLLGDSASLVEQFLRARRHPCGGFLDREGKPDLYYTVFGREGLMALRCDPGGGMEGWLAEHGDGEGLDFVHLCCLARCWSSAASQPDEEVRAGLLNRIESFRSQDGGYNQAAGRDHGTAYGALLGWSAWQDLGATCPDPERLLDSLMALRTDDGGWSNERGLPVGVTPAAAAGVALCRHLRAPVPDSVPDWLLSRCLPDGGFCALPGIPLPDLLSTAVALHALDAMQVDYSRLVEPCLNFVDSLWNSEGGFHGNWTDDDLDCEYTYYGLLSLGHLSL
jgi:prenyltransferase beta subunit